MPKTCALFWNSNQPPEAHGLDDITGMSPSILIRNETDADAGAITVVTIAAFRTLEISNHTEQFNVAALRAA